MWFYKAEMIIRLYFSFPTWTNNGTRLKKNVNTGFIQNSHLLSEHFLSNIKRIVDINVFQYVYVYRVFSPKRPDGH